MLHIEFRYEEDNFVRKPLTKVEMTRMKRLRRGTNLNSLTSFDDARLLLDDNINAVGKYHFSFIFIFREQML